MNRSEHALAYNGAVDMKRFHGAPLFAEEDMSNITAVSDSAWMRDDGFEARHLKGSNASVPGSASISYTDGHVGSVKLPMDKKNPNWKNVYFTADAMCIRTRSKWISGNDAQVNKGDANFGIIGKSANTTKRTH